MSSLRDWQAYRQKKMPVLFARETAQQDIITFLEARFGDVPGDVVKGIESIDDHAQLKGLVRLAAS